MRGSPTHHASSFIVPPSTLYPFLFVLLSYITIISFSFLFFFRTYNHFKKSANNDLLLVHRCTSSKSLLADFFVFISIVVKIYGCDGMTLWNWQNLKATTNQEDWIVLLKTF